MMKIGDGPYVVGIGPFEEFETPPEGKDSFYCNDFSLSDPRPWKVPSSLDVVDHFDQWGDFASHDSPLSPSEIDWCELEPDGFASVFSEINDSIYRGKIEKSVPVATEYGELVRPGSTGSNIMGNLKELGAPFYSYAWSVSGDDGIGRGFCGASPELLFALDGRHLTTMALAGTAKADERDVFSVDGKEIREHEFVAQTLVAKLSDIGHVARGEREMMDLGQLVHFHTSIDVELFASCEIDDLIRRLHPTPALGPLPRTEETLKMLSDWRSSLSCPSYFGAPFGLLRNGVFHAVVAIRSVHWDGNKIAIPAGCGVIEASRLVNEWRELRLKREAVKNSFALMPQ